MDRIFCYLISTVLLAVLGSCRENNGLEKTKEHTYTLFKPRSSESTNITFVNQIIENDTFNMVDFFYVYNGGGVAIGDINNDSLPDIYFTGNMVNDRLYLNRGNLTFEDISEKAGINKSGWSTGVTMVDINHDGLLDIYVCRSGNYAPENRKNLLYINQGNLKFDEQAEKFGLADTSYSTQAAFLDYDQDGDLDMYLLNHTNTIRDPNNIKPAIKDGSGPANDRLYKNNEAETSQINFSDVTKDAGILYDGLGLGIGVADMDGDGWDDIFVTNDFIANDYLYINQRNGTFKEMARDYFNHTSHFSMGNDLADFNNDGLTDAITLDMLPFDNFHRKKMSGPLNNDMFNYALEIGFAPQYMQNTLQLNRGTIGKKHIGFSEIGQLTGISATDWSWAPLFADFDNDGWKDIFITNGYLRDITDLDFINYTTSRAAAISADSLDYILKQKAREMPSLKLSNVLYRNSQNIEFEDVTEKWGLSFPSLSNGAAYADLDRDGDLDIITNNINEVVGVFENLSNDTKKNNFLSLRLEGNDLNRNALGAKVTLYRNTKKQVLHQSLTRGYQSSVEPLLHFGLGRDKDEVDSLVTRWPDGSVTVTKNVDKNQFMTLSQAKETPSQNNPTAYLSTQFKDVTEKYSLQFVHNDPPYNDFDRQYLIPRKHSNQGPGIAVADINGDGLDDFYVGAGYENNGSLFCQMKSGTFSQKKLLVDTAKNYEEDTGVLFFDYDGDGDNDLYIASGSNEFYENSEFYQDRLYTNDGKGNFKLAIGVLPPIRSSTSCVRASDFDGDGDLDLFVGGRLTPLKYPLPPNSFLLVNVNGKFEDQTNKLANGLKKVGMVTDALWTDWDNDFDTDLIVVGEFLPIQFFENQNGKLVNISNTAGPLFTSGWWNSINGADFDNDGDIDYVLGNLGLNNKFKASEKEPLTVYALDYDLNGSIDPLVSYFIDGEEYPVPSRDNLLKQIPELKKRYPDYESYAKAKMEEVLPKDKRSKAFVAKAFLFATTYLENKGNSTFVLKKLPQEAQIAPVYGIIVDDFDTDGDMDILLSGNDYGTEAGTARYDAFKGVFLKGNGRGNFEIVDNETAGLDINGGFRGASKIVVKGEPMYLFGANSEGLIAYTSSNGKKVLNVPSSTFRAKITYKDGTKRLFEFYYGSSFLSQSTRSLNLLGNEKKIVLFDFKGRKIDTISISP